MTIIVLGFVIGFSMAALGAYLTYLGAVGNTEFTFFGQAFKSTNIGIAAIFIAAALMVLVGGRVLKTVDRTVGAETTISKQPGTGSAQQDAAKDSVRFLIHLPESLRSMNLQFGVLHVRNGKDELPDSGPPINQEYRFKTIDRSGNLEAVISAPPRRGFQFKCFVDYEGYQFEKVKELLERAGFKEVTQGLGRHFRAWFILPEYDTYRTMEGY